MWASCRPHQLCYQGKCAPRQPRHSINFYPNSSEQIWFQITLGWSSAMLFKMATAFHRQFPHANNICNMNTLKRVDTTAWQNCRQATQDCPDSKVHGANMGPTWVLSVPAGPHVGPMNLAIWVVCRVESVRWCCCCSRELRRRRRCCCSCGHLRCV